LGSVLTASLRCRLLGGVFVLALLPAAGAAAQIVPPAPTRPPCPPEGLALPAVPAPPAGANLPAVTPVVCQSELAKEVPALGADDPALQQPLESVRDFDARLRAQEGASATVSPSDDPALAQPLTPLGQFDVREVDYAQRDTATAQPELRFVIRLDGLQAADDATGTDLAGQFKALSALQEAKGKAANEAQLSARLEEDSKLVIRILQAEGWYDAAVQTRIDKAAAVPAATSGAPAAPQPVTAVISVVPGERYKLGSIAISAAPVVPADLVTKNLPLKVGEPIVAERIQGAEANVAVVLPQQGYPFAKVGQRDVLLDQETHLGDYTLPIELGPRARFGGFRSTGKEAFDIRHVEVLSRFKRGELYDSRQVDDLRQALVATGLFRTVAVVPERTGQTNADGTENVTVLVTQDAGPPRTLAASAGYGTGQGFRVEGSWTHRNLLRPEGALIATAVAGTQEQGASLIFRRSNAGKRDRTFQGGFEALRSRYDAFDALTGRLFIRLSRDSTPIWRKTFTWAVGAELLGTVEDDYDFDLGKRTKRRYGIGALSGQVGFDQTDSLLDPTKGYRAQVLVQPEGALSDGFRPYVRSQLDASAYYPVSDGIVFAGRARIGTTVGIDRADLAPSRRFYAGGGGSVRGYGYQQLGPKDPNGRPLGGLSLVEGAAEVRYRFGNYGIVGFVDAGQVYAERTPSFQNLRAGVGIGGRFYTNFGPLRLDVATPVGRKPGESRFNIYISIGQAF